MYYHYQMTMLFSYNKKDRFIFTYHAFISSVQFLFPIGVFFSFWGNYFFFYRWLIKAKGSVGLLSCSLKKIKAKGNEAAAASWNNTTQHEELSLT
jgi:hypothetical protein